MKQNNLFSHLGLTKNETRVYKTLIRPGPSSIGTIMQTNQYPAPIVDLSRSSKRGTLLVLAFACLRIGTPRQKR